MKLIYRIFLLLILFAFLSCQKSEELMYYESEKLIGYWTNPQLNDTLWTFERTNRLADNQYGFAFKPEHVFIERKNSGWCATPPIAYSDFEGSWMQNDSVLSITVGYWGGMIDYHWKIIWVDKEKLSVYKIQ